jgi:hypothetical protein
MFETVSMPFEVPDMDESSPLVRFLFILLVFVACFIFIQAFIKLVPLLFATDSPYLIKGFVPGNTPLTISQDPSAKDSIPIQRSDNESGIEFSWSVWLNITDVDSTNHQYKHIFHKGEQHIDTDTGINSPNNAPGLYISPNTNELVVIMNTFKVINEEIKIPNFPMNKWVHVLIRNTNNALDVYINGALAKRHILSSVPKQNNGNVYVSSNGGFSGNLSDLRYFNYALSPGKIISITNGGPNLKANKNNTTMGSVPPYLSFQWYTNE